MTVIVKDRGWNEIKSRVRNSAKQHLVIGILGPKAHKVYKGTPVTTVEVATWNHFGTPNIPARPFISGTIDSNLPEIRKMQRRLLEGVLTLKITEDKGLGLLGEFLRKLIVEKINDGFPPPNAESTKQQKRSSTPLVDTGQLKGSITYQIRKGNG